MNRKIPEDKLAKTSPRFQAVVRTLEKVMDILEEKDRFEMAENWLLKQEPEAVEQSIREGKIYEKWFLDLFAALTRLYDEGHSRYGPT